MGVCVCPYIAYHLIDSLFCMYIISRSIQKKAKKKEPINDKGKKVPTTQINEYMNKERNNKLKKNNNRKTVRENKRKKERKNI